LYGDKCFSRILYPIFWKLPPEGAASKKLGVQLFLQKHLF
jgi:hypothetical protein